MKINQNKNVLVLTETELTVINGGKTGGVSTYDGPLCIGAPKWDDIKDYIIPFGLDPAVCPFPSY